MERGWRGNIGFVRVLRIAVWVVVFRRRGGFQLGPELEKPVLKAGAQIVGENCVSGLRVGDHVHDIMPGEAAGEILIHALGHW